MGRKLLNPAYVLPSIIHPEMSCPGHRVIPKFALGLPRKVRTPQSEVVGNAHPEKSAGSVPQKINRRVIGKGETVV